MENKIFELRKDKKLTQEALAKKCKVSRQTINVIENDRYNPTLKLSFKLVTVLGSTVDEIFKEEASK